MLPDVINGVAFRQSSPGEVETDLLILPIFEGDDVAAAAPGIAEAAGAALARALETREIQGHPYELFLTGLNRPWRAARLLQKPFAARTRGA